MGRGRGAAAKRFSEEARAAAEVREEKKGRSSEVGDVEGLRVLGPVDRDGAVAVCGRRIREAAGARVARVSTHARLRAWSGVVVLEARWYWRREAVRW